MPSTEGIPGGDATWEQVRKAILERVTRGGVVDASLVRAEIDKLIASKEIPEVSEEEKKILIAVGVSIYSDLQ